MKVHLDRREFLYGSTAALLLGTLPGKDAVGAEPQGGFSETGESGSNSKSVYFIGDGLSLSPVEYVKVLETLVARPEFDRDTYGVGGDIGKLEAGFAKALGKEAAIFLPTGTLANHLAVRRLARRGKRIIVQEQSHIYNDAGDCAQSLSGLNLVPITGDFTANTIESAIEASKQGRVDTPIGAISLESPVRRAFNTGHDLSEIQEISRLAKEYEIGLHLDGARLFMQAAHAGISPRDFAREFDTVYVSLYKNFNAAGGAILAGSSQLLQDLADERRMFGGSPCFCWPLAAVALHFMDDFNAEYCKAKAVFETLCGHLEHEARLEIEKIPSGTNATWLHLKEVEPARFIHALEKHDIHLMMPRSGWPGVLLMLNPTVSRRSATDLAKRFIEALG